MKHLHFSFESEASNKYPLNPPTPNRTVWYVPYQIQDYTILDTEGWNS